MLTSADVSVPVILQSTGAGMQASEVENSKRTLWVTWLVKVLMSSRTSFKEPGYEFGSHTKVIWKVSRDADGEAKAQKM